MSHVRKLSPKTLFVAYVATSIDGRIAENTHSEIGWTSKEDWYFFQKSLKKFDAVVVGHNTYKVFRDNLSKRNSIVFTRYANKPRLSGSVAFFNPQKYDFKKFIKNHNYKKIAVLGGPKVYDFFLKGGMLDELFVTIEPHVFTAGVPMFSGAKFKKYKFSLLSVKRLNKKGTLLLKYKNAN
ncbi:MAG: dihydrofolate reductase [Candidatus Paceibacterota bacterium]